MIVSPGHTYVPPGVATSHLRLSFSTMTPAQADRGSRGWRSPCATRSAAGGRDRSFESV